MIHVYLKSGEFSDDRELCEIEMEIIEAFEDFLDKRGIVLNNPERDEDRDASTIYGSDYGELEEAIGDILYRNGLVEEVEVDG